jgi:hypothetical protein
MRRIFDLIVEPEHESRANMFVAKVEKMIKPDGVKIDVENTTTGDGQIPEVVRNIHLIRRGRKLSEGSIFRGSRF